MAKAGLSVARVLAQLVLNLVPLRLRQSSPPATQFDYNAIIAIIFQEMPMTSITVRNLDESIKVGLRLRAAKNGWSMEQEVRHILQTTLAADSSAGNVSFAELVSHRFKGLKADTLPIPQRHAVRPPPDFSDA